MTTNITKTVRFTKAMRFADLAAVVKGENRPNNSTDAELLDFITHETDLLAKKNNADIKKPTATQEANAKYRELIAQFLSVQSNPVTCTEIAKGVPELADFNNQKVAALLKRMVDDGRVVKTTGKGGKSLFAMA